MTAVLAEYQLTPLDVFEACRNSPGFKPNRRTASQAAGGPRSDGISGSCQVVLMTRLMVISPAKWGLERVRKPSTYVPQ